MEFSTLILVVLCLLDVATGCGLFLSSVDVVVAMGPCVFNSVIWNQLFFESNADHYILLKIETYRLSFKRELVLVSVFPATYLCLRSMIRDGEVLF